MSRAPSRQRTAFQREADAHRVSPLAQPQEMFGAMHRPLDGAPQPAIEKLPSANRHAPIHPEDPVTKQAGW